MYIQDRVGRETLRIDRDGRPSIQTLRHPFEQAIGRGHKVLPGSGERYPRAQLQSAC